MQNERPTAEEKIGAVFSGLGLVALFLTPFAVWWMSKEATISILETVQ